MKIRQLSYSLCLAGALSFFPLHNVVAAPAGAPTSEKAYQVWKYTTVKPGSGWQSKSFGDSKWKSGKAGFGTKGTPGIGKLGTIWKTKDIWLRRTFKPGALTASQIAKLNVRNYHDEDIEVFINGVLAYSAKGYVTRYESKPISSAARKAIVPGGTNVIAVHCHQTQGGQYIDVGLEIK